MNTVYRLVVKYNSGEKGGGLTNFLPLQMGRLFERWGEGLKEDLRQVTVFE